MARAKKKEKNIQKGNSSYSIWSWERLVRDAAFNKGYKDFKAGFWDYDYYDKTTVGNQWQYERGRHFAAAGGPTIKSGRTTNPDAIYFFRVMWHKKELV